MTPVYTCLLDASKAFDRVNPAKPEYRNMCPKFFSICIYVKMALM